MYTVTISENKQPDSDVTRVSAAPSVSCIDVDKDFNTLEKLNGNH